MSALEVRPIDSIFNQKASAQHVNARYDLPVEGCQSNDTRQNKKYWLLRTWLFFSQLKKQIPPGFSWYGVISHDFNVITYWFLVELLASPSFSSPCITKESFVVICCKTRPIKIKTSSHPDGARPVGEALTPPQSANQSPRNWWVVVWFSCVMAN